MAFNAMEIFQDILLSTRFCRFKFRVQDIFHFHEVGKKCWMSLCFSIIFPSWENQPSLENHSLLFLQRIALVELLKSLELQYCDSTSIVGTVSTAIGK